MAVLNPMQKDQDAPVFTNRSDGVRPTPSQSGPPVAENFNAGYYKAKANQSKVGETLATIFDPLVKVGNKIFENHIEEEIQAEVDQTRDEFGVGAAATIQAGVNAQPQPLPQDIANAGKTLEGLAAANEAGRLPDSHYWARLESMVRQMKTRFPGHKQEVDEMVSRIAGTTPANALRRALQDEREAAARAAGDDPTGKLLEEMAQNNTLHIAFPNLKDRIADGNPPSYLEVLEAQSRTLSDKAELDAKKAKLDYNASLGKATKEETEAVAAETIQTMSDQYWNALLAQKSTNGKTFRENLASAQTTSAGGGVVAPEQAGALASQLAAAKSQVLSAMRIKLMKDYSAIKGGARLDKESMDNIIAPVEQQFALMEEYLVTGKYSLLNAEALRIDAMVNHRGRELLDNNEVLKSLAGFRKIAGDDVAAMYLSKLPNDLTSVIKTVGNQATADLAQGKTTLEDANRKIAAAGGDGKTILAQARTLNAMLNDPKVSEEIKDNLTQSMFSAPNWNMIANLRPSERMAMYRTLTSPETQKTMMARKGSDPEGWSNYVEWSKMSFIGLFQETMDNVNEMAASDTFDVTWDPSKFQLRMTQNPDATPVSGRGDTARRQQVAIQARDLNTQLGILNSEIFGLAPILMENGSDPGLEIQRILRSMGISPSSLGGQIAKAFDPPKEEEKPLTSE
jgi:hypothetical protein